jgi:hypothetical protein
VTPTRSLWSRRGLLAYGAAWIAAAAVVVGVALLALDGGDPDPVSLPPVEETKLARAARSAGCALRREQPGERLNPPVSGAVGTPAGAGVYDEAPHVSSLVAALRRGIIVIHVRGDVDDGRFDELRSIQAAAPNGTIVTPNETGMRFEVGATSYRRLLGCERLSEAAVEALLLFRGRYLGSGPGE